MVGDPKKLYSELQQLLPDVIDMSEKEFIALASDKDKFSKLYQGLKEDYPEEIDLDEKTFISKYAGFEGDYFKNQLN